MDDIIQFEDLIEKYGFRLYKYCYFKTSYNKELAEECLNDIFEVIFKKWDSLIVADNITAYLYRVADNCIKHNISKGLQYYYHNESLDQIKEYNLNNLIHYDNYFDDDIEQSNVINVIMERLPEKYRQIFKYRFVEKKTLMQTSKLLGIPYSSLRLREAKIKSLVRDIVKNMYN